MRRFLRENGLSVALLVLFLGTFVGQIATGRSDYNDDRQERNAPPVTLGQYLTSGHFVEATFENWESEFLQMGAYVLLTIWLKQKGSPDSKKLDEDNTCEEDPTAQKDNPDAPWPVRRGGLWLVLYKNSLASALFGLFALSFLLHAGGSVRLYNEEQRAENKLEVGFGQYLTTSHFWFQSLQNWQSEFLSVGALVVLTIFLRQYGSPQSKSVAAPHKETGE